MSDLKDPFLSIVIPVYNEEESLPPLHSEITEAMVEISAKRYEIILVDDGSRDDSHKVCCRLYDEDPSHVRVIRLRRNFGQTAAMAAGFDAARGDIIIPMDADLQNDPRDIGILVDKIRQGFDVVSGWRADRKDKFLTRRVPSILANAAISGITGVNLHDYGCTLKAYRREIMEHMHLYGEMHRFLPALARWAGAHVTELKVNHRPRKFGTSKYGLGRTVRVILDLITVKFLLSYSTKPMQVFGKLGIASFAVGFASGALSIGLKLFANRDVTDNPWMLVSIFFMLGGLQLICMGLLGEINVRTYYESQNKTIYTVRDTRQQDPDC